MSINQKVLEYLQKGNSLTPIEALNKFGCFRLGAAIHDLRKEGFDIETIMSKGEKHFAIYRLKTKQEQNGQMIFV